MLKEDSNIGNYINSVSPDFRDAFIQLRTVINENIPQGFREGICYGMVGWTVPHSTYPAGYHCNPSQPLPFVNLGASKNHVSIYHMGIYGDAELMNWFVDEYFRHTGKKPDIGKSCIRFKKKDNIPYKLIGELMSKIDPQTWIAFYEKNYKK